MARLELYLMSFLQKNPEYLDRNFEEIADKINEEKSLNLTWEDIEASWNYIKWEGGDGVQDVPQDFDPEPKSKDQNVKL